MTVTSQFLETNVSWLVDEIEVNATLTVPQGEGPFPAVLMVAGSGPTDRNWNTPLIPGTNGSAALLARVLNDAGFVTLRYDKRVSGPQANDNLSRLMGKISKQGHVDELAGGMQLLAGHSSCGQPPHFRSDEQRRLPPCHELPTTAGASPVCRTSSHFCTSAAGGRCRPFTACSATRGGSGWRANAGILRPGHQRFSRRAAG